MMSQDESCQSEETSWRFLRKLEKIPLQGQKYHVIFPSKIEAVLLDVVSGAQSSHLVPIDQAPMEFSFFLTGYSRGIVQYSLQSQKEVICAPGSSLFSFLPQSQCRFQLFEKQHYRILNIYIPPEIFWETFENQLNCLPGNLVRLVEARDQQPYKQGFPMSCHLRILVEQIFQCPYQGILQKLYLEAKTMEILVRYLWELTRVPCQGLSSLRPSERDQIHGAKDILLGNLANPPSLNMLARTVGLNPNKLNQGFRQEFGTTVFAWYRATRLQRSCELLEQGQFNIDEIAQTLGFHDSPHFIRRFKQYFGKTPGAYLKERRI